MPNQLHQDTSSLSHLLPQLSPDVDWYKSSNPCRTELKLGWKEIVGVEDGTKVGTIAVEVESCGPQITADTIAAETTKTPA